MQATFAFRTPRQASEFITRTLVAINAGAPIVAGAARMGITCRRIRQSGDLPELPRTWRAVGGSESTETFERFIAYETERGIVVTLHSVVGPTTDTPGRLVALVTLGRFRVSIVETQAGFEARWACDDRRHCLAAGATTLSAFLPLVLNLNWPVNCR